MSKKILNALLVTSFAIVGLGAAVSFPKDAAAAAPATQNKASAEVQSSKASADRRIG